MANEYATLNPSDKSSVGTLSNGNLTFTAEDSGSHHAIRATQGKSSGKWYWEITGSNLATNCRLWGMGELAASVTAYIGGDANGWGSDTAGYAYHGGSWRGSTGYTNSNVVRVAIDLDNHKVWIGVNNSWNGDPAAGTDALYDDLHSATIYPMMSLLGSATAAATVNFGASSFAYTVPSGFNAGWYEEGPEVMPPHRVPIMAKFEWQPPVKDKDLTAPPGGESKGDRYLIVGTGTSQWADQDGNIATYTGTAWEFTAAREGMLCYIKDEDKLYLYTTAWAIFNQTPYATAAEINTGTEAAKAIAPDQLAASYTLCPVGTVLMWPTDTAPSGYLECNGASLLRAGTYAALFGVLGTLYGTADGTHFNLPDYRGRFPRAWDHAKALDPDRATRTVPAATGATLTSGDHVGTEQADEFKSHLHAGDGAPTGAGVLGAGVNYGVTAANTGSTGGNETRSVNVNLMFIIKY